MEQYDCDSARTGKVAVGGFCKRLDSICRIHNPPPWSDMTNCFEIAPSDRCRLSPAACRIHHLPSCQFVLNRSHIAPFGCHRPEETKCFCVVILEIMSGAAGDENYVACLDLMGLIIDDHGSATGEDVIELLQPRMAVRM